MERGMMRMVRTVLGDIEPSTLGHTQCHEHIFIEKGASYEQNPALCMDDPDRSTRELNLYYQCGGRTILDAQPPFCGRMAKNLVSASVITNVHIVSVTGFHKRAFYPASAPIFHLPDSRLIEFFVSEIRTGMIAEDGKRISARAGAIKIAFDSGIQSGLDLRLMEAVITAARQTGAPIIVHTEPHCDVMSLIKRMANAGIDSSRVILCHMDRTFDDFNLLASVLEWGAYLNFDSINRLKYLSHQDEIAKIMKVVKAGYGHRLLLSLDTTNKRLKSYGAAQGLDYILTEFLPLLKKNGLSPENIYQLMQENPANALAFHLDQAM